MRESVTHAYEHIWKPRYELWAQMSPEERLQLSVEGMRGGHLSGPRHRGDVGVSDEGDRYVMSLDPCGSCGILRRGDPDSGRPSQPPAGNLEPHPWTWGRTGMSWYSVHSPIALEYIQMADGAAPAPAARGLRHAGPAVSLVHLQGHDGSRAGSTTSGWGSRRRADAPD